MTRMQVLPKSDKDWVKASGEMADLIRKMDWTVTPLGSRDGWSKDLRTALNLVLASGFPMAILWGSELILLYNDSCRAILGDKHPQALGRPTRDVWAEVWNFNKPILEKVMTRGETIHLKDQLFQIHRHGYMEDAYFTISYSPIHVNRKAVAGTLITLLETTEMQHETLKLLKSVQEEKDKLTSLIGSIADEVWFADLEKRFTLANPSALREFAIDDDSPIDVEKLARDLEVYHPDGTRRAVEAAPALRALQGEVVRNQVEVLRTPATGELRYRQVSSNPVRNAVGTIIGSVSVVRDITTLKQAEESLRKANANLEQSVQAQTAELTEALHSLRQTGAYTRSLIEASLDPLVTIGRDGTITDVNAATETVTGRVRQELIGTDFSIYFTDPDKARTGYQQVFEDGSVRDYPLEVCHRDGHSIPVLYNAALYRDEAGQVVGIFAAARDITERKRAEEALLRREQEFRALAEAVPQIVWAAQADGGYIYFNQKWVEYTGQTLEESYGGGWSAPFHPDDRQRAWDAWERATQTAAPYSLECRLRRADGIYRWWLMRGEPMRSASGEVLKWFGTCTDIEDLKQASEQLRRITSELMLTEQRERQQLAQVLHDGLQQILVAAKYRLAYVPRSQNIHQATEDVLALIDDAIETSRSLTAELSPPILLQGDLFLALEWLARWMRDKHELEVTLLAGTPIEPLKEEIILLLFQAARELLFNVVKHAGVKAAHVDIKRLDERIVMTIEDEGAGFHPNLLRTQGGHSGGIGLIGIKERLLSIGGHMEIDSAPGKGSRFKLIVPQPLTATETDPAAARRRVRVSVAVSSQQDAKQADAERTIRIVLVDDHMVMRQGLAGLLRMEPGFEIAGEASDGESAVGLIRKLRPDVVLMDISMPGMDGIQATRIVHKELPDIRIIGLSMFQEGEQEVAMRKAGAVDYLTKSGPSESLIQAIRNCVRASRNTPARRSRSYDKDRLTTENLRN